MASKIISRKGGQIMQHAEAYHVSRNTQTTHHPGLPSQTSVRSGKPPEKGGSITKRLVLKFQQASSNKENSAPRSRKFFGLSGLVQSTIIATFSERYACCQLANPIVSKNTTFLGADVS